MDQKFLERQRKNLLDFRAEIEEDVQKIAQNMSEADSTNDADDREDIAAINTIRELDRAGSDILSAQLDEVNHALAAIEDGTYGTCQNCGKAINPERLQAKPWATLCIDCQEATETGQ